jgi:dihydroorotate dehydrogenase (NAD+) catalytic subunit
MGAVPPTFFWKNAQSFSSVAFFRTFDITRGPYDSFRYLMHGSASNTPQVYDYRRSYDWNYSNAPETFWDGEVPRLHGTWDFCGLEVNSPLGMPAGPLLNSAWILHYAKLGFDVLTYKTVRSIDRPCYEQPNLLPVTAGQLTGKNDVVSAADSAERTRSWAISFGMPSKDPSVWRADVERARKGLSAGQVLVVSVVASPQPDSTPESIAQDFAQCAYWAKEAGAHAVEANLSCPNVCTSEGQLYTSPDASRLVSQAIRHAVGNIPVALKIGLFGSPAAADAFIGAVSDYADALSTTNSISASVVRGSATLFDGLTRGIGGVCIRDRCLEEVRMLSALIANRHLRMKLIGVGGVFTAGDVLSRLEAGAHHLQLATAAMLDPFAGIRIRQQLLSSQLETEAVKTSEQAKNLQSLST